MDKSYCKLHGYAYKDDCMECECAQEKEDSPTEIIKELEKKIADKDSEHQARLEANVNLFNNSNKLERKLFETKEKLAESEKKYNQCYETHKWSVLKLNERIQSEIDKNKESLEMISEIKQLEIYDFSHMANYQTKIRNLISLFLQKHEVKDV